MATKTAEVGSKRKSTLGGKAKPEYQAKKFKIDKTKSKRALAKEPEDGSEDSEDGGVDLNEKKESKPSDGKTFERGMFPIIITALV